MIASCAWSLTARSCHRAGVSTLVSANGDSVSASALVANAHASPVPSLQSAAGAACLSSKPNRSSDCCSVVTPCAAARPDAATTTARTTARRISVLLIVPGLDVLGADLERLVVGRERTRIRRVDVALEPRHHVVLGGGLRRGRGDRPLRRVPLAVTVKRPGAASDRRHLDRHQPEIVAPPVPRLVDREFLGLDRGVVLVLRGLERGACVAIIHA